MNNEFKRMQKLAGLITESQLSEEQLKIANNNNIVSFLKANKQELLQALSKKFNWDQYDMEIYNDSDIEIGADDKGNEDPEIAGLGEGGLDFSFNKNKVKDTYGDASNFTIKINGKNIYGISYSF